MVSRALHLDGVLEVLEGALALLGLGRGVELRAVEEGPEEVDDAGGAGVGREAPGVTGEVDAQVGAAVVRAVAAEHLGPTGVDAGHAHGVLDGLGAAVGEEDVAEALRGVARR